LTKDLVIVLAAEKETVVTTVNVLGKEIWKGNVIMMIVEIETESGNAAREVIEEQ
jgi:hypothetical protein